MEGRKEEMTEREESNYQEMMEKSRGTRRKFIC